MHLLGAKSLVFRSLAEQSVERKMQIQAAVREELHTHKGEMSKTQVKLYETLGGLDLTDKANKKTNLSKKSSAEGTLRTRPGRGASA